ncbi:MAG: hypothetical protein MHM6MM_001283 [Cercozoa sp. M6MM]
MDIAGGDVSVRVVVRFRPINNRERQEWDQQEELKAAFGSDPSVVDLQDDGKSVGVPPFQQREAKRFTLDAIFGTDTTQSDFFERVASSTVKDVLQGFNGTLFCYGQTGSGKTFSMFGADVKNPESELAGIIPRSTRALFEGIERDDDVEEVTIKVSFLEIYREKIRDLLNPTPPPKPLKVREQRDGSTFVEGLTEVFVTSVEEVFDLIRVGGGNRAVAATSMNADSSRSHSLLVLRVEQKMKDGSTRSGKLNFADLAGSEKVRKTGASGETLEEAKKINQSLSALGNCIKALTVTGDKKRHVPFRDSKLTFILKDALGGNTKTTLITTASPHAFNLEETISTLRFAQRAKLIKNQVHVNRQRSVAELEALVAKLRALVRKLRRKVAILQKGEALPDDLLDDVVQSPSPSPMSPAVSEASKSSSSSSDDNADESVHSKFVLQLREEHALEIRQRQEELDLQRERVSALTEEMQRLQQQLEQYEHGPDGDSGGADFPSAAPTVSASVAANDGANGDNVYANTVTECTDSKPVSETRDTALQSVVSDGETSSADILAKLDALAAAQQSAAAQATDAAQAAHAKQQGEVLRQVEQVMSRTLENEAVRREALERRLLDKSADNERLRQQSALDQRELQQLRAALALRERRSVRDAERLAALQKRNVLLDDELASMRQTWEAHVGLMADYASRTNAFSSTMTPASGAKENAPGGANTNGTDGDADPASSSNDKDKNAATPEGVRPALGSSKVRRPVQRVVRSHATTPLRSPRTPTTPARTRYRSGNAQRRQPALYEGALLKETGAMLRYTFRARYVILRRNCVEYFRSHTESIEQARKPRGRQNFGEEGDCWIDEDTASSLDFFFVFKRGKERYRFRAASAKDRQQWVQKMKRAIESYYHPETSVLAQQFVQASRQIISSSLARTDTEDAGTVWSQHNDDETTATADIANMADFNDTFSDTAEEAAARDDPTVYQKWGDTSSPIASPPVQEGALTHTGAGANHVDVHDDSVDPLAGVAV